MGQGAPRGAAGLRDCVVVGGPFSLLGRRGAFRFWGLLPQPSAQRARPIYPEHFGHFGFRVVVGSLAAEVVGVGGPVLDAGLSLAVRATGAAVADETKAALRADAVEIFADRSRRDDRPGL